MPNLTPDRDPVEEAELRQRLSVDEAIDAGLSGTVDDDLIGDAAWLLALEVIRLRNLEADEE